MQNGSRASVGWLTISRYGFLCSISARTRRLRATPYRRSKAQLPYSADNIRVVMNNGWLTLEGNVEWNYQKERAEEAVRHVRGVKGVTNLIGIKPQVTASEVKRKIEQALKRSAEVVRDVIRSVGF